MNILPGLPGGPAYEHLETPRSLEPEQSERFTPLRVGEKGVVLWAGLQVDPSGRTMSGLPLNPQELRSSLLLWDRLDWPANDFLSAPSGPDEEFLIAEGILRRSRFATSGRRVVEQVVLANSVALERAEMQEPGRWSMSRGPQTSSLITDPHGKDRGLLIKLYECLPLPSRDVPLADILEFKEKRRDELQALRQHLERVYQSILAAPDRARAEENELAALDQALAAHIKTIQEAPFKKVLGSLEASLDVPALANSLVSGVTAFMAGLPLSSALLAGAGSLGVSLGLGRPNAGRSGSPFEYVTSAHKELL